MAPLSDFLFRIMYRAFGDEWMTLADDVTYDEAQKTRRHMERADEPVELRIVASRTRREAMVPSFDDHETWDELAAPYVEDAEREARLAVEQHSIRVDPDPTEREEA